MANGRVPADSKEMRRLFLLGLAFFVVAVPYSFARTASKASGTTFYVSPAGSDSNPGTAAAPWQTVARVNNASLQPGDSVLFQGGQTFTNASLIPSASGTTSAPIHFGSYGTGRARLTGSGNDIWIPSGGHDLSFDNLDLTGSSNLFASSATGPGSYDITLQNLALRDTPAAALNIANPQDHDWTINNDTFTHTGDSAIFVWGNNITISHSTISDTGWNTAITWGKHGIYDKGPNTTIAYNDFSDIPNGAAVSLRFHGAHVYGNTIHDTPYAIAFFDYDTAPAPQGTNYVYDNRLWNITGYGFYYSNQTDPQGHTPTINFILASNTFSFTRSIEAVNVSETPAVAAITLANNIFTGSYGSAYRGCATCTENNNDWYGGTSNIPTGPGDKHVNPALSPAPQLALSTTSPVHAAGTALVRGLTYKAACDGVVLHYCGGDPDQGAIVPTGAAVASRLTSRAKVVSSTQTQKPGARSPSARAKVARGAHANGIRYFTFKKNVKLRPGLRLHYAKHKGYYAAT